MQKKVDTPRVRALIIIMNLLVSLISFSIILNINTGLVSGAAPTNSYTADSDASNDRQKRNDQSNPSQYMGLASTGFQAYSMFSGDSDSDGDGLPDNPEENFETPPEPPDTGPPVETEATPPPEPGAWQDTNGDGIPDTPKDKYGDMFGITTNYALGHIIDGIFYAGIAAGAIQMIGGIAGLDQGITNALTYGAMSGIMAGKISLALLGEEGILSEGAISGDFIGATGIGLGVGLIVFALTYSEESTKTVQIKCDVWDAPSGGTYCERCNEDPINFPCTEYKCHSLGSGCELLNKGTTEEKCAWINSKDVNTPTISPNYEVLSEDYEYTNVKERPPGIGMEITHETNEGGCIEAFFPIEFGIVTNEPAQCKIDYNHTINFEDMQYYFGGSTSYRNNHTQKLSLPSPNNINSEIPELQNDGIYTLFVRCEDANGNVNDDEYGIKFCVDKGPDTTPPKIESTSLINDMPVAYEQDTLEIEVYTNEPANCKWSREDKDYNVMENSMSCSQSITEINANLLYTCKTELTGIEDRKNNPYYFRCKDQPTEEDNERNENQESYLFNVKGTQQLNILDIEPNRTKIIEGSTSIISVDLELETGNGFDDGEAICFYSTSDIDDSEDKNLWVEFFETNSYEHRQQQNLEEGFYEYYFKCVDLGGNVDFNYTNFTVEIDNEAPELVRVYHDSGESSLCSSGGCVKIQTNEDSICSFSTTDCNYEIDNGIPMPFANSEEHYAEWDTDFNYYIRCKDDSGNEPPTTECTAIVKAYNLR